MWRKHACSKMFWKYPDHSTNGTTLTVSYLGVSEAFLPHLGPELVVPIVGAAEGRASKHFGVPLAVLQIRAFSASGLV